MTLTTLIVTNAFPAAVVVYALVHGLVHAVHADRRHRETRLAEITALPRQHRDRVAA